VPKELDNISLSNFQLLVVANPNGWTNPDDGKHYSAGLAVAGTLEFYGLKAKFAIQVNYNSGIYAMGQIDKPLVIGDVVTLANAVDPAQGPYVEINTANSPYLKLSASLTMFDIVSQKIDAEIDRDSFHVHFQFAVAGLGNTDINAYLKNKREFAFDAKAFFNVSRVGPIKVDSLNLGTLNPDLLLNGHFGIAVSTDGSFSLTIGAEFDLYTLHLKLNDLTLQEKITRLADLPEVFKRQLAAVLWNLGKSLFQNAQALFDYVRSGGLTLTDDIGKILNHYLNVGINEAARLLKSVASVMQYDSDKVGGLLVDGFNADEEEIAGAMKYAGYEAEETANVLVKYFNLGANEVANFLRQAGFPIDSITRVLRIGFGWSAEQVANLYKNAWGVADTTVNWALEQGGYAKNEIEKAMNSVFGWFRDVWEDIEDNIDPGNW
jgi:hypothetical protein